MVSIAALLVVTALATPAVAHETGAQRCMADSDGKWTGAEQWTWRRLCQRQTADLREYGEPGDERTLRGSFFEAVFLDETHRRHLADRPVRIAGAELPHGLVLRDAIIPMSVFVTQSVFDGPVDLSGSTIAGSLSFAGSEWKAGDLSLRPADDQGLSLALASSIVAGGLDLTRAAFDLPADLTGASVAGSLEASDATISGFFSLDKATIGGSADFSGVSGSADLIVTGTAVGGDLAVTDSTGLDGYVFALGASIGGSVLLTGSDFTFPVAFLGAEIGGSFVAGGVTFRGDDEFPGLVLGSATVGGSVFVRRGAVVDGIRAIGVTVGQDFDLSEAEFGREVTVERARIRGAVFLNDSTFSSPVWMTFSEIDGAVAATAALFTSLADLPDGYDPDAAGTDELPAVTATVLSLDGSTIGGTVDLGGQSLFHGTVSMVNARPRGDVRLDGSLFEGTVDLTTATVGIDVIAGSSEFQELIADGASIAGDLIADEATVRGGLSLVGGTVGRTVSVADGSVGGVLDLVNAAVGADVRGSGATIGGGAFDGMHAGRSLDFTGASVRGTVSLHNAVVADDVVVRDAEFLAPVDIDNMTVGGDLVLADGDFRSRLGVTDGHLAGDVDGTGATIAGDADFTGTSVAGALALGAGTEFHAQLVLDGVQVAGGLSLAEGTYRGGLTLTGAVVGADVDLARADLGGDVDFTGTSIGGRLQLVNGGREPVAWHDEGRLELVSASVGGFADLNDEALTGWPTYLGLSGLDYANPASEADEDAFINRRVDWFESWLARVEPFSAEPYRALEDLLRAAGRDHQAENLAMARHDRQAENGHWVRRGVAFVHKWTVGYGYKPEWSIAWILALVVVGWAVGRRLIRTDKGKRLDIKSPLLFSVDRLLPLVTLQQKYHDIDMEQMPRRYAAYYGLHMFAGYVLAAFLVAALSGITTG